MNNPKEIQQIADQPGTLIFLHVPKTAGTSLIQALIALKPWDRTLTADGNITVDLLQQYSGLPIDQRANTLIYGHALHGTLHAFSGATLLTVIRNPEEHVVSNYLHALRHPELPLHRHAQKLPFEEFLRVHWGYLIFQCMSLDVPNSSRPFVSQDEFFCRLPAIYRTLNAIDFVGVTDDLKGFLSSLTAAFRRPLRSLEHLHRSSDFGISDRTIAELRTSYRSLADDPVLGKLIAAEYALYALAKSKANFLKSQTNVDLVLRTQRLNV